MSTITVNGKTYEIRPRADLQSADLQGAYLRNANLTGAYLTGAYLRNADLQGADLQGANLTGANLQGADLPTFSLVPEEGPFVAYKKVRQGVVLQILVTGKRTSSLVGRKCRCDALIVVAVVGSEGQNPGQVYTSLHDSQWTYEVGKTYTCPDYDDDIRVECAPGLHFFLTRKEAEEYE